MSTKIATEHGAAVGIWHGNARVYRVTPALVDDSGVAHDHVIVARTRVPRLGSRDGDVVYADETALFPADMNGALVEGEFDLLDAPVDISHEDTLVGIGYTMAV